MNIKKKLLGTISLCFLISSMVGAFPCKSETTIIASAIDDSDTAHHSITLEDVKAIQAFCLTADYVGPGSVIDVNNDGLVDVFDLTLAKKELINTGVPSLVDFSANVCDIYLNKSENVVFTLNVTEITPLEDNAISVYDDNNDFVAFMHDDGTDGDEIADDGIYSAAVSLSSDEIKTVDYYAATDKVKSNSYEICFYRNLEEDEFKNFWILYSSISSLSFNEACDFIKSSSEIKTYEIDEQSKVITYQSIYGIYGCWEEIEELPGMSKGSGAFAVPETNGIDYSAVEDTLSSVNITPAHSTKKDVIVLRPFRNSEFQYDDFQTVGNLLADALDSNVTVVDDGNVTLEQMKNLASYGTVLIDSHGMLKSNSTPYMLIGEDLDETKFLWDIGYYLKHIEYSADYLSGRIYCTSFRSGQQIFNRMAVGGKFFKKYYSDNSLTGSFWFLGTCYSMHDNSIADALTGKSAEAVVGFTNPVSVEYCNNTLFETVLNSMVLSSENVNYSVIEARRIYGQTDPSDSNTTIQMKGKTNFKLVNDIQQCYFPELVKTYSGTYVAQQGLTSLDFTILSCSKQGDLDVLFSFHENPANVGVPNGCYRMRGKIEDVYNNRIIASFEGTEWINKPSTYEILNFTALIDLENDSITSSDWDLNLTDSYKYDFLDIAGKYSGTYQNNSGLMGLDFSITSCSNDGEVSSLFSFYPHQNNPNAPSGSYTMIGKISNIASNGNISITFMGEKWIEKPDSYGFANFTATINADRSQLKSNEFNIDLIAVS